MAYSGRATRVSRAEVLTVPSFTEQEEYRTTSSAFVSGKAEKYALRDGLDRMEAISLAYEKEQGRMDQDSVFGDANAVLLSYVGGADNCSLKASFFKGNSRERFAKVAVSSKNSKFIKCLRTNKNTTQVSMRLKDGIEFPLVGQFQIRTDNAGEVRVFPGSYHISERELNAHRVPGAVVQLGLRIPLYLASATKSIVKNKFPVTHMYVGLDLDAQNAPRFRGLRFSVMAKADAHEVLYAQRLCRIDHPSLSTTKRVCRTGAKKSSATVVEAITVRNHAGNNSIAPILDELIGKHASRSLCNCETNACSCRDKDTRRAGFSWSLSHMERLICCTRGNDSRYVGQLGEVLVSTSVLIRALEKRAGGDFWLDDALHDPAVVRELLSDKPRVLAALDKLYSDHGRIPTLAQLASHTSGLPHIGSLDVECFPSLVETFLPCAGEPLSNDASKEERLARVLEGHVSLIGPPGGRVVFSMLGISVLSACLPSISESIAGLCSDLGMSGTGYIVPEEPTPGSELYGSSRHVKSTTNDLCQIAMGIERSSQDANSHRYLSMFNRATYRVKMSKGEKAVHSVSLSGMQSTTVRIRSDAISRAGRVASADPKSKISMTVFYKLGEHDQHGSSMFFYCPALHAGFSAFMDAPLHLLFGSRSHSECGYGKKRTDKIFRVKHFLKQLTVRASEALATERGAAFEIDSDHEMAWCNTPHRPPRSSAMASLLDDVVPDMPAEWKKTTSLPLFGENAQVFYPLGPSIQLIDEVVKQKAGSDLLLAEAIGDLTSIRISSDKQSGTLFLSDRSLRAKRALLFDAKLSIRCGVECARDHKLHSGGFRVMPLVGGEDALETVLFHAIPTKPTDSLLISYRGVYFASEELLKQIKKEKVEAYAGSIANGSARRTERVRSLIKPRASDTSSPSEQIDTQLIAARGAFWGGVVGGALAGAAVGSLANPYYYRRPYYPAYYPPPPYPVYY